MSQYFNKILLLTWLLVAVMQTAWSEDYRVDDVDRVVAIADIHGAYDAMVETLQQAGIVDAELRWSGGRAQLVVVGDILDRGPDSRAAMDFLMRIEAEAAAAEGHVHVLIGNHESMLLTGDLRYVSAAEYQAFAADEDPAERTRWFELYVQRTGGYAEQLQSRFDKEFPPGYFAMRRAFRADGHYGRWLLTKNVIAVINRTAFVHGGLSPAVTKAGLHGVNRDLQAMLVEYVETLGVLTDAEILLPTDSHYDYASILKNFMPSLDENSATLNAVSDAIRLGDSVLLNTGGPLWYRSNVTCPGIVEEYRLEAALAAIDADRVVVGHTPTPTRQVLQRFGGRLIEIDTGMLNFYYKGSGNALVIEGDTVTVVNQGGIEPQAPAKHPRRVGRRAGDLSMSELEALLKDGEIVAVEKMDSRTLVRVSNGEQTVTAIVNKNDKDGFFPNVAAYRLDRLLELDMVPVSVIRDVEGRRGSLQFLPENSTDEMQRVASGQGSGASCPLPDQWAAMYVFDVLVYNEGRTKQRMIYDRSTWRLILSEHERAFSSRKGRPPHLRKVSLPITAGWKETLAELNDERLAEQFSDVLDKKRLRALAARRDALIAIQ